MAPSYAKANEACQNAAHLLKTSCVFMERHLPPIDGERRVLTIGWPLHLVNNVMLKLHY